MSLLINLSFLLSKPTGTTTYALNLLPHFGKYKPTLLTAQSLPDYNCYQTPTNQTSEQGFKGHFKRLVWTQFQLPQIYDQLKSNLLFSPIPEAPIFTDCRQVIVVHDLTPLRFPKRFSPLTAYCRYYLPQILAQAQHIICDSTSTATDIVNFFDIPSEKITPILLACDTDHFHFLDLETSNYFLYIGRHDRYKNLARLIDAFANLANCHDYELWLIGTNDDRYTPALILQAQKLGIENQVKFLNYVPYDRLPIIINQAIALVFPSLWEGFGLPVLEAMACGTPVITSNLSSLPEVAGDAAILINPYHVEEITDAMQMVANDSGLRSQLSQRGLARSHQFSWERTGIATMEILQQFM